MDPLPTSNPNTPERHDLRPWPVRHRGDLKMVVLLAAVLVALFLVELLARR